MSQPVWSSERSRPRIPARECAGNRLALLRLVRDRSSVLEWHRIRRPCICPKSKEKLRFQQEYRDATRRTKNSCRLEPVAAHFGLESSRPFAVLSGNFSIQPRPKEVPRLTAWLLRSPSSLHA